MFVSIMEIVTFTWKEQTDLKKMDGVFNTREIKLRIQYKRSSFAF